MAKSEIRKKIEEILNIDKEEVLFVFTDKNRHGVRQKYCFVQASESQISQIAGLPHVTRVVQMTERYHEYWGLVIYFNCRTTDITLSGQSIPNGTKVRFDHMGMIEDWKDAAKDDPDFKDILKFHGCVGKITCLCTYSELGDPDYEYYNVKFQLPNGKIKEFEGISGYNLTPVK